jgi:hypothetical protein
MKRESQNRLRRQVGDTSQGRRKGRKPPKAEYSAQADYIAVVSGSANRRQAELEKTLRAAFKEFIDTQEVELIAFSDVTVGRLADALTRHPIVLKPLLAACNIAARAIERDLGIRNLNTYKPRLSRENALAIAAYLKSFLPASLALPTLSHVDRIQYIDKEVRMRKGQWEQMVIASLNALSPFVFQKRRFSAGGEQFELDAATPKTGPIEVGIDVKRIEARRDIHKRTDEIVNKAAKLKSVYPAARFAAIIYYPFVTEHVNIQNRLDSPNIEAVGFAGESNESVRSGVGLVLAKLQAGR